ncbi:hypothetical protein EYF80_046740 [Liparis tanakae]|uniref:Uncharacterized protein n=1 Tax=Liparis tanakae TaxID=230148 RepID=A0A4Z2FPY9_9TELE|nr:hypothetical protein EYF80_046740 [Liparis tanakae]
MWEGEGEATDQSEAAWHVRIVHPRRGVPVSPRSGRTGDITCSLLRTVKHKQTRNTAKDVTGRRETRSRVEMINRRQDDKTASHAANDHLNVPKTKLIEAFGLKEYHKLQL